MYNNTNILRLSFADLHLMREINIDKICSWKPLFKLRQQKTMALHLPPGEGFGVVNRTEESLELQVFKVGYEVYADGSTRVLRICVSADSSNEEKLFQPRMVYQLRVSNFALYLFEESKQVTFFLFYHAWTNSFIKLFL